MILPASGPALPLTSYTGRAFLNRHLRNNKPSSCPGAGRECLFDMAGKPKPSNERRANEQHLQSH